MLIYIVGGVAPPGVLEAPPDEEPGVEEEPGVLLLGGALLGGVLEPGALLEPGVLGVVAEPEAAPLASNLANSAASRLPSLLVSSVFHCFSRSLLSATSRLLSLPFLSLSIAVMSALAPALAPALPLTLGLLLVLGLVLEPVLGLVVDGVLLVPEPLLPEPAFGSLAEEPDELGGGATCATADAVKPIAAAETAVMARSRCKEFRFITASRRLDDPVIAELAPHH